MVEQIFSKKLVFEKNLRKGSRGLGAHFPPPYPGVTPPRIRRTGPPSSNFSEKKIEKKLNSRPCRCRHRPAPAPSCITREGFTSQAVERSKDPVRNARMDWA